jgi:flagellar hook-associated protein 3 FlgL
VRITNQLIRASNIANVQAALQAVNKAREQVSTGKRVQVMSDDPAAASMIVRASSSLRALGQFRRATETAQFRATAEGNVLDQLTNSLDRGTELATGQANSTSTAQTRLIAKGEVDQLLSFTVGLGNTKVGDDYIFGGTRGAEAPLQLPTTPTGTFSGLVDAASNPVNPSGSVAIEIRDGHTVIPNHNATEVFLNSNALQALRDLSTALGKNDVPGINSAATALHIANDAVQGLLGAQGARSREFLDNSTELDKQEVALMATRSDLRDVEMEKAMVELAGRTTGYQAAMTATSKVLGLTLANYL